MGITLSETVQIITIIAFLTGVIKYLIVNPLQSALAALKEAVDKLEDVLERLQFEQKGIDRRLVVVEESAKAAHKRLDDLVAK